MITIPQQKSLTCFLSENINIISALPLFDQEWLFYTKFALYVWTNLGKHFVVPLVCVSQ